MSREKGNLAEDLACKYLIDNGYKIVERNFYSKFGELDIIAIKDKTLHIFEVKSGKNFDPIYSITPKKIEKIILTIDYYMMKNSIDIAYQIDAIIIKDKDIELIENISIF